MSKLLAIILRPVVITIAALVLLSLVLWFGGFMLQEKRYLGGFPSDTIIYVAILAIWLIAGLVWVYRVQQARKRARIIAERLRAQAHEQVANVRPDRKPEIEALEKQFEEALATLNSSRLGKSALYDLPWYMIVGPPGSGKTTMLKESNLNFPTSGPGGRGVRGVGGTRNCDWWFTDDGILLDTAGRYTTEAEDHDEWLSFLEMLRKARKHKPINGAIVAISIQDIVGATEQELVDHSATIRDRIAELMAELDMVFPIYLVFTKCDLLDGFVETFGSLGREQRAQVWGTTLTPALVGEAARPKVVGEQLDLLYKRLGANRLGMLGVDRPSSVRQKVYSFPLQFSAVRDAVVEFVEQLSQTNPLFAGVDLRGVYFTSGTQEGAPIDRVLSKMSEAFGLEEEAESVGLEVEEAKSYFIDDLLTKVVFRDKELSHRSEKALRRSQQIRQASFWGTAALLLVTFVLLISGYFGTSGAIGDAQKLLAESRTVVRDPGEPPKGSAKKILARLNEKFTELTKSARHGLLLGRNAELLDAVRDEYLRQLEIFFLVPAAQELQRYFRGFVGSQRSVRLKELEGMDPSARTAFLENFADRLRLFEMIGVEASDVDQMQALFVKRDMWSWDPALLGKDRDAGRTPEDRVHLTGLCAVAREGGRWQIEAKGLDDARSFLRDADLSTKIVEDLIAASTKVDDIEDFHRKSLAAVDQLIADRGKRVGAPDDKVATAREIARKLRGKAWLDRLAREGTQLRFDRIELARQELAKLTGANAPIRRIYQLVRDRVAELPDFQDMAVPENAEAEWLNKALEVVGSLDGKMVAFAPVGGVIKDLTEGGPQFGALSVEFGKVRVMAVEFVNKGVETKLRRPMQLAMGNLINAMEGTFERQVEAELRTHWEKLRLELVEMSRRYPFDEGKGDVSTQDFTAMFGPGGKLERVVRPIDQFMLIRQNRQFDSVFAVEYDRLKAIRSVFFPEDHKTVHVPLRIQLEKSAGVENVFLHLGTGNRVTEDEFANKGDGKDCVWEAVKGAGLKLKLSNTDTKNRALPFQFKAKESKWNFLRLVHSATPTAQGLLEWAIPQVRPGEETVLRRAYARITDRSGRAVAPFAKSFWRFQFPTKVFKD